MNTKSFNPDFDEENLHIGSFLESTLQRYSMKQVDLADRTGLSTKTINAIIQGKAPLTAETAYLLEFVFPNVPASVWIEMESNYQSKKAYRKRLVDLGEYVNILKDFPIASMVNHGWIERKTKNVEKLMELLKFFGVAKPNQLEPVWAKLGGLYRQSTAYSNEQLHVMAWLRQGENQANKIICKPFNADKFKKALQNCRELTNLPFSDVEKRLPELCAEAGVAVVFVKEIGKTHTTGAARWVKDKAIIQLSLRGKRNDIFWFTFFHECGHILLHGKKGYFIDGSEKESDIENNEYYNAFEHKMREAEADSFSQDILFPRNELETFLQTIKPDDVAQAEIEDFANKIGISPGIVLGHLQHRKLVSYASKLNSELKIKYDFA